MCSSGTARRSTRRTVAASTPLDVAILDEGTTRYFASLLQLELNEDGLGRRKAAIAESLRQHGATAGRKSGVADLLMQMPLFNHLWFLWFLWWLVLGYAAVSALGSRLPSIRLPAWLVLSPARYLWLIPLTMIPQWFMGDGGASPIFGPDTSTGLLPIPHVLAYYAIFFGFGALYFGFDDRSGRVGERWWLPLSIGLLVILPLGMALTEGWAGPAGYGLAPLPRRVLSVALAGGLPLAHHVRPHGIVPAGLPGREPDDAVPVGLGVLALPRPSAADHRGPATWCGTGRSRPSRSSCSSSRS